MEEARAKHTYVFAHAYTAEAITRCVELGVRRGDEVGPRHEAQLRRGSGLVGAAPHPAYGRRPRGVFDDELAQQHGDLHRELVCCVHLRRPQAQTTARVGARGAMWGDVGGA